MPVAEPPCLRVGTRARAVRGAVGPTAWVVLEELVLAARHQRAEASVRSLGRDLGLAKDTVATALRRLIDAGLVRREDRRDPRTGAFAAGGYVLDSGALADVLSTGEHPRPPARRSRVIDSGSGEQVSLFEDRTGA